MKCNNKKVLSKLSIIALVFIIASVVFLQSGNKGVYLEVFNAKTVSADEDIYTEPNSATQRNTQADNDVATPNETIVNPQNSEQSLPQTQQITSTSENAPATGQNNDSIILAIVTTMLVALTLLRINSKSE